MKLTANRKFSFYLVIFYTFVALVFVNEGVTLYYHAVNILFLLYFLFCSLFVSLPKGKWSIYTKRGLLFSIFILLSFIWSPNSLTFNKNLLLQASLIINSIALYYFVKKYNLLNALIIGFSFYIILNNLIFLKLIPIGFFSSQDSFLNGRFIGTNVSSNLLAIDICFWLFMTFYTLKYSNNKYLNVILYSNIVIGFMSILATGSKKGLMAFSMLLFYHLYRQNSKSIQRKILFFPAILFVLVSLYFIFGSYIAENFGILNRFSQMIDTLSNDGVGDESTSQRFSFIEIGWDGFLNSPVLGHGQDAFSYFNEYYAHNNYIELLYNLGLIGFVSYYLIYLDLFRKNNKSVLFYDRIYFLLIIMLFLDTALVSYNLRSYMIIITFITITIEKYSKNEKALNH